MLGLNSAGEKLNRKDSKRRGGVVVKYKMIDNAVNDHKR